MFRTACHKSRDCAVYLAPQLYERLSPASEEEDCLLMVCALEIGRTGGMVNDGGGVQRRHAVRVVNN